MLSQARQEFDTAIDLMLEASANNPSDRQAFEARLDEMVDAIHRYDLAGLGAGVDVDEARFDKAPLEDLLQMTFPVDPKLKDKVREQVQATASQLPLSENDAVLGYINYFSGRGRRTLIAGLERAGRYRPLISRILQEEGIPQELIYLAQAESGFFPRAISRKAAAGMWQFVAWRGQQYGLMRTANTDDRLDPEKATRASARHLHDLYNSFGDWYLAMAAYNCGPVAVARAVERTGYADFWELRNRHALPVETTNYVPIILAMTIMTKNAAEYGLEGVVPEAPLEYDTIEVSSPTHLALVADMTDAPLQELAGTESGAAQRFGACWIRPACAQGNRRHALGIATDDSGRPQGFVADAQSRERRDAGIHRQALRHGGRQHRRSQWTGGGIARAGRAPVDPGSVS